MRDILSNSLAISTQSAYATGTKEYLAFCAAFRYSPWQPSEESLSAYVCFSSRYHSVPTTLKYLSAARMACIAAGFPWPTHRWPRLQLYINGVKRKYGVPGPKKKTPITSGVLLAIMPDLDFSLHDDRCFWAASCVAVYKALRGSEFLWAPHLQPRQKLLHSDLVWSSPSSATLCLSATKVKWWRNDVSVTVTSVQSPSCPVAALQAYLDNSVLPNTPGDFLFRLQDGSPLSRKTMMERTYECMTNHDLDTHDIGSASWRSGGAMTARAAGMSSEQIRALGRWSSDAYAAYLAGTVSEQSQMAISMAGVSSALLRDLCFAGSQVGGPVFTASWLSDIPVLPALP
jgi:hypothetical protein